MRLFAPRKYGKTSLLGRVLRDGERSEGLIPITVDLYGVLSVADLTVRIERAYARQLKGKTRARIEEFLQSTGLGLSLGAFGVSAQLQIDPKIDPLPALHALLDLPLRLEEGGGYRALIVFDEFQDIVKVREADAILRSHIQYQGDVASYIFSGSEPGMMEQIFESRDRPLYGSAVPMRLERLAARGHRRVRDRPLPRDRSQRRRRAQPAAADRRRTPAAGDPARAPALGGDQAEGDTATLQDWRAAHEAALRELSPEFDAHWRGFGTTEQKSLRAILGGGGSPLSGRVLTPLQLDKATAHKALRRLAATADVELTDGSYRLVDPLFAQWIDQWIGGLREDPAELIRATEAEAPTG